MIVSGISLAAQQSPETNASVELRLVGVVRTSEGTPIPGCTLRVIQTSTGKAWVSWTDENGKFDLPGLPGGHYRVEVSQLGFAPATKELELAPGSQAPFELKLDVGTLAALNAPPAMQEPGKKLSANLAHPNDAAALQPSGEISANRARPAPAARPQPVALRLHPAEGLAPGKDNKACLARHAKAKAAGGAPSNKLA